MFAKKIVVAYNDTDLSNDLLSYVHTLLKLDPSIELDIIFSYESPLKVQTPFNPNYDDANFEMEELAQRVITKGEERFAELPNNVQGYVYSESPANAILDHTEQSGADLIIIGNRGFSGLREFVSSVSRTVQSKAKVPVLIFPKFDDEDQDEDPEIEAE